MNLKNNLMLASLWRKKPEIKPNTSTHTQNRPAVVLGGVVSPQCYRWQRASRAMAISQIILTTYQQQTFLIPESARYRKVQKIFAQNDAQG